MQCNEKTDPFFKVDFIQKEFYVMWRNLDIIIIIDSYEKKDRFLLMIEIWKICQRLK